MKAPMPEGFLLSLASLAPAPVNRFYPRVMSPGPGDKQVHISFVATAAQSTRSRGQFGDASAEFSLSPLVTNSFSFCHFTGGQNGPEPLLSCVELVLLSLVHLG